MSRRFDDALGLWVEDEPVIAAVDDEGHPAKRPPPPTGLLRSPRRRVHEPEDF